MKTQPDKDKDVAQELAERLADAEAANDKLEAATNALKEELERKNKALEDFLAENEALKAELGGKNAPPAPVAGKDAEVPAMHGKGSKGLDDLVAQARRLGW